MFQIRSIVEDLGGKTVLHKNILSDFDLINAIHEGLPIRAVDYIFKKKILSKDEFFKFVTSQRTFDRRRPSTKLSEEESDKLVRILRILAFARQVLGDLEAGNWLRSPNPLLKNKMPIDLLDSDAGAQLVESLIGRIAHGIIS